MQTHSKCSNARLLMVRFRNGFLVIFGNTSSASESGDYVGCWHAEGPIEMLGNAESLIHFKCLFLMP